MDWLLGYNYLLRWYSYHFTSVYRNKPLFTKLWCYYQKTGVQIRLYQHVNPHKYTLNIFGDFVALCTCIWKVTISNLAWDAINSDRFSPVPPARL